LFSRKGIFDAEYSGQGVEFDVHRSPCLFEQVFIGVGEEEYCFFGMVHKSIREARLIFDQQSDAIFAGNVPGGNNGEFIPRNIVPEPNVEDFPACEGASHGDAVDHFRESQVVHITRSSGDLSRPSLRGTDFPIWLCP